MTKPADSKQSIPSPEDRVRAIREREQKATKGPWVKWVEHPSVFCNNEGLNNPGEMSGNQICECEPDDLPDLDGDEDENEELYAEQAEANADFIAHARADIPYLLSLVEELIPFCDSPCGHTSQYAYSEDGGKNIVCLICEREELKKLAAPGSVPQAPKMATCPECNAQNQLTISAFNGRIGLVCGACSQWWSIGEIEHTPYFFGHAAASNGPNKLRRRDHNLTLFDELKARGYDLTTLKFSVSKVARRAASQEGTE